MNVALDIAPVTAQEVAKLSLSERDERIALRSIEAQRESYGPDVWSSNFITEQDAPELFQTVIPQLRRTVGFRFAAAFSDNKHIGLPRHWQQLEREREARGNEGIRSEKEYRYPLEAVLVDPRKVPEKLAASLGLINLEAFQGDPAGRLEHLGQKETIAKLKAIFRSLVPVFPGQTRFMRISDTLRDVAPELVGTVIHFRESPRNNRSERRLRPAIVSHFSSGHGIFRKTVHEGIQYELEVDGLASIEAQLATLLPRLDKDWKTNKEQLMEEAPEILSECAYALENAISPLKAAAYDLLEAAATLRDKRGAPNPSAAMSKITAARKRIEKRITTIGKTRAYSGGDGTLIGREVKRQEKVFELYRDKLATARDTVEQYSRFFESPVRDAELVRQMEGKLAIDPSKALQRITIRPFTTFASLYKRAYDQLESELLAGTKNDALSALSRIDEIARLHEAHFALEDVKLLLAQSYPSTQEASRRIGRAHIALQGREESLLHEELFVSIDTTLSQLTSILASGASGEEDELTSERKNAILENLKDIDVEERLLLNTSERHAA